MVISAVVDQSVEATVAHECKSQVQTTNTPIFALWEHCPACQASKVYQSKQ